MPTTLAEPTAALSHPMPPPGNPSAVPLDFERCGSGPPLVLVHGCFSDQRTNWSHVKPHLARHFTVYAIARRGRGATPGSPGYGIEDEMEDAAALIRQIGTPVFLLGHSYGAHVALGAAARVPGLVRKLVLYEGPWPNLIDPPALARLEAHAARGDWEALTTAFFTEVLAVPPEIIEPLRGTEDWAAAVTDAPRSLHDLQALARHNFDPERYAFLPMPVLLQVGTESTPEFWVTDALAATLPDARVGPLAGQAHEAMTTAPEDYAAAVRRFLEA